MTASLAAMTTTSTAAQTLASLSAKNRRERSVEVKRIVAAYRRLRPDLPSVNDITILRHLADELEADAAEAQAS